MSKKCQKIVNKVGNTAIYPLSLKMYRNIKLVMWLSKKFVYIVLINFTNWNFKISNQNSITFYFIDMCFCYDK